VALAAEITYRGRMAIDHVTPDYHADQPKACMGSWGRGFTVVTPTDKALPCHAAETIPGVPFPDRRTDHLNENWEANPIFVRFRGKGWMSEPRHDCTFRSRTGADVVARRWRALEMPPRPTWSAGGHLSAARWPR
jgi:pyrroloquinoline quinone biosynthesis protein E